MTFFAEYSLFFLKILTFVIAFLVLFAGIISLGRRSKTTIQIDSLNDLYREKKKHLQKSLPQNKKKTDTKKNQKKKNKAKNTLPSRFILSFEGDMKASAVSQLRDEISMILSLATPKDEVIVRIESPGGEVSAYGLAASQLARIRNKNIPLTICIDKIAASGGYLMACVADKILAAPFAIIGSIGVVAQLPNFHRLLKKNHIDIELLTAGKYKRTLTMLGENTKEGREKFKGDLEAIQALFREHVFMYRQQIDIEKVSTGEHWLAKDALALGLVDELKTSDDYLYDNIEAFNTLVLTSPIKQSFTKKILKPLNALLLNTKYLY